jgi:hypothetical protein
MENGTGYIPMEPLAPDSGTLYRLGQEGIEYIRAALRGGGPLATELVRLRSIGQPFTFLPSSTAPERVGELDWGGHWTSDDSPWPAWIASWIRQDGSRVALAENFEIDPGSPLLTGESPFVLADGRVLFFSDRSAPVPRMYLAMSRYPSILVLTSRDTALTLGQQLTRPMLQSLASAADYVLVGAYDEESLVAARCEQLEPIS